MLQQLTMGHQLAPFILVHFEISFVSNLRKDHPAMFVLSLYTYSLGPETHFNAIEKVSVEFSGILYAQPKIPTHFYGRAMNKLAQSLAPIPLNILYSLNTRLLLFLKLHVLSRYSFFFKICASILCFSDITAPQGPINNLYIFLIPVNANQIFTVYSIRSIKLNFEEVTLLHLQNLLFFMFTLIEINLN